MTGFKRPMTEEESPTVKIIEAHEEFIQHIEVGTSKIKALSLITMVVAALLAVGFVTQLVLPFVAGEKVVEVNLADPLLVTFEIILLALALLWFYVGTRDYLFMRRLGKQIREARREEQELFKKAGIA